MTGTTSTGSPTSSVGWAKAEVMKDWDDPDIVQGWSRWHDAWSVHTAALTQAVVEAADVRPGMRVLDLACGTGEPAITLAETVGPAGAVVATDLSENTLESVRDQLRRRGLTDRVDVRPADMEALPFGDAEFDAVTCRLGLMFAPQLDQALAQIRRVLKPGGRAGFVVWGSPMDQGWSGTMLRVFSQYVDVPGCAVGVPTPWRFADEGSLAEALETAGFTDVVEQRRRVEMPWPGDGASYWDYVRSTAAPARQVLDENPPQVMEPAIREVIAGWNDFAHGERLVMPGAIGIGSGCR